MSVINNISEIKALAKEHWDKLRQRKQLEAYIKLEECEHGGVYLICARNFSIGVYNENANGFIGMRHKFGSKYLFTEYHWDTGEPFGTVKPIVKLTQLPESIIIEESFISDDGEKYLPNEPLNAIMLELEDCKPGNI